MIDLPSAAQITAMPQPVQFALELPEDLARLHLPPMHQARLQALLDQQDHGENLTDAERAEAEELVEMSELFSLLRMRSERLVATAA